MPTYVSFAGKGSCLHMCLLQVKAHDYICVFGRKRLMTTHVSLAGKGS